MKDKLEYCERCSYLSVNTDKCRKCGRLFRKPEPTSGDARPSVSAKEWVKRIQMEVERRTIERCAKVCEELDQNWRSYEVGICIDAIRALPSEVTDDRHA